MRDSGGTEYARNLERRFIMRIKILVSLLFLFLIIPSVVQADTPAARLEAIKSQIPEVWDGTIWDKTRELSEFLASHPAKDSTGAEAMFLLGYNYRVLREFDRALAEYKRVIAEYPNCPKQVIQSQLEIAQLYYWDKRDYKSAASQYQAIINLYPNSDEARYAQEFLGRACEADGQQEKALVEYQKAFEKGNFAAGIAKASILLKQASSLAYSSAAEKELRDKKFRELLTFYKKLYQSCPIDANGGAALGEIIDGVANAFAKWDGSISRSARFVYFQKYGPEGQDKTAGTDDDLTDPLAKF